MNAVHQEVPETRVLIVITGRNAPRRPWYKEVLTASLRRHDLHARV